MLCNSFSFIDLKRNLAQFNFMIKTEGGLPVREEYSLSNLPGREQKLHGGNHKFYLALVSAKGLIVS